MNAAHPPSSAPPWDKDLVRELAWVLAAKSLALFLIWLACFSEPIDDTLTESQVHQVIFATLPGKPEIDQREEMP